LRAADCGRFQICYGPPRGSGGGRKRKSREPLQAFLIEHVSRFTAASSASEVVRPRLRCWRHCFQLDCKWKRFDPSPDYQPALRHRHAPRRSRSILNGERGKDPARLPTLKRRTRGIGVITSTRVHRHLKSCSGSSLRPRSLPVVGGGVVRSPVKAGRRNFP
jgi:hypothetical protein